MQEAADALAADKQKDKDGLSKNKGL